MADDRIKGYDQQKIGLDGVALRAGAGAVGGIVAKTATAPLERVKMLLQVQAMNSLLTNASAQPKYKGIVGTFRKLYAEEGFLAMFHGNGANVIGVFCCRTLHKPTDNKKNYKLNPSNHCPAICRHISTVNEQ